jgi:signal transduction histidine kinase
VSLIVQASDLPTLQLDRTRMRLLLRNLLDNALRHSVDAPHPPEISLRANGSGLQHHRARPRPGVPDDQLPHLAQPFYRPDTARERATGGVGWGCTCASWWRRRTAAASRCAMRCPGWRCV